MTQPMKPCNTRSRGSILIILLWMLMAMSILCISFAKAVRVEANAAANSRQLTNAYYLAQAGISESIYKLIVYRLEGGLAQPDQRSDVEPKDVELGKVQLHTDIGDVDVEINDEDGKINVNRATKEVLLSLLLNLGAGEEKADIISDSILDWVDFDDDYHANGAESDYYMSLDTPYPAKNSRFDTVEELLLVRGVDSKLFYGRSAKDESGKTAFVSGLNRCLTVYGTSGGVNVNSAPYPVLLAIGLPPEVARAIIQERGKRPFLDNQDFSTRVPDAPGMEMLKAPIITRPPVQSAYFSLVSTAKMKNSKLKKTIFAVVRINARYPLRHSIVYWNENYFLQENESYLPQEQD